MENKVTIPAIKGVCNFKVWKIENPLHGHSYHIELFFPLSRNCNQYFNAVKPKDVIKLIEQTKLTLVKLYTALGGGDKIVHFTNEHRKMILDM